MTSRYFAAFCLRTPESTQPSRFGFTLPRAVGKAVHRNKIKRRMREAVRSQCGTLRSAWVIVFNPRRGAETAPFEELCGEIGRIFARCNEC